MVTAYSTRASIATICKLKWGEGESHGKKNVNIRVNLVTDVRFICL